MPQRAQHPCAAAGCGELTAFQYCGQHIGRRKCREKRGTACKRGYDRRWRKARLNYLRHHPICVLCQAEGRVEAAIEVDHVEPHRGSPKLFWDEENWQALCRECHQKKTGAGL